MTFTDYAAKHGCQLLKDDYSWLRGQLQGYPKAQIQTLLREYVALWVRTMAECESAPKAQNEGRRAANCWLRGVIDG